MFIHSFTANCSALGMENGDIKDTQLTSSTNHQNHPTSASRLNHPSTTWCAAQGDTNSWIQVIFNVVKTFTGLIVQGFNNTHWVTSYKVRYSTGTVWYYVLTAYEETKVRMEIITE